MTLSKKVCRQCSCQFETELRQITFCSDKCSFLSKCDHESPLGCWEWKAGLRTGGYGQMRFQGKLLGAHKASYILFNGEVPDGLVVCHRCDNPKCVNPKHLFLGQPKDNTQDMIAKGRNRIGESHPNAKLTEEQVKRVFSLRCSGMTLNGIAAVLSVSKKTVLNILKRRAWTHVDALEFRGLTCS